MSGAVAGRRRMVVMGLTERAPEPPAQVFTGTDGLAQDNRDSRRAFFSLFHRPLGVPPIPPDQ